MAVKPKPKACVHTHLDLMVTGPWPSMRSVGESVFIPSRLYALSLSRPMFPQTRSPGDKTYPQCYTSFQARQLKCRLSWSE